LKKEWLDQLMPVETNIIIFSIKPPFNSALLLEQFRKQDILVHPISHSQVRLVTHLDITPEMVAKTIQTIQNL
jgi:threonine aldolase